MRPASVIFNSGLLMVDRTLYVATNYQTVAIDAATCAVRWRNVLESKHLQAGVGARGLGYADGKVFGGTTDGRVIAFDAKTGEILWDVPAADSPASPIRTRLGPRPGPDDAARTVYTTSLISVDTATGRLKLALSAVPRDEHD